MILKVTSYYSHVYFEEAEFNIFVCFNIPVCVQALRESSYYLEHAKPHNVKSTPWPMEDIYTCPFCIKIINRSNETCNKQ